MSSPVDYPASSGPPTGEKPEPATWLRITQWRNWKLPVKLVAVVLVPVLFAITLGVLQIRNQIGKSDDYARIQNVVQTTGDLRTAIGALQEERSRAAESLAGSVAGPGPVQQQFPAVDVALRAVTPEIQGAVASAPVVAPAQQEASRNLQRIAQLRQQVLTHAVDAAAAVGTYNDIIGSLLRLDQALSNQVTDPTLSSSASALHELDVSGEEIRLQQALISVSILQSGVTPELRSQIADSQTRRATAVDNFRAAAPVAERIAYDQAFSSPHAQAREGTVQQALATAGRRPGRRTSDESDGVQLPVSMADWKGQAQAGSNANAGLQIDLGQKLQTDASDLHDRASDAAGLYSVVLLSALLIAGAVVFVIGRQLLGSLQVLRRSALDAARVRLPQVVAEIRAGSAQPATVDAVPVETDEEVGQVARAFDAVNRQAIVLASEQAGLRKSYRDSFVNMSRRSQTLVERQLRLFEQLEKDEEDPDQLSMLFQLDHLAARMRRNNENLMVLSGADLARRFNQPVPLADLVRAGNSEIEHYPRVVVQPLPETKILAYVCSDLVRLFAELLDNAANFSAPETNVVVSGYRRGDGSVGVDIVDRGIGMQQRELETANANLASPGEVEFTGSRRMGLFVVRRLASRHGVQVQLNHGPQQTGVQATVILPPDVLAETASAPVAARTNGGHTPMPEGGGKPLPQGVQHALTEQFSLDPAASGTQAGGTAQEPVASTRNGFVVTDGGSQPMAPTIDPGTADEDPSAQSWPSHDMGGQDWEGEGWYGASWYEQDAGDGASSETVTNLRPLTPEQADTANSPETVSPAEPAAQADDAGSPMDTRDPAEASGPLDTHHGPTETYRPANTGNSLFTPVREPSEEPADQAGGSGEAFPQHEPSSDNGTAAGDASGSPQFPPHTPIFDELASAWFQPAHHVAHHRQRPDQRNGQAVNGNPGNGRSAAETEDLRYGAWPPAPGQREQTSPAKPTGESAPDAGVPASPEASGNGGHDDGGSWNFGSDDAWRRAEDVSASRPTEYTEAGLPRRQPKENLVAGSAAGNTSQEADHSQRDPERTRGRLSSFQRGLHKGREGGRGPAESAEAGAPLPASTPQSPASRAADATGTEAPPLSPSNDTPSTSAATTAAWSFSADSRWQEAEQALQGSPNEYTSAGLPRRVPKSQLAPGSAGPAAQEPEIPDRDAEVVRGRLASFQNGLRRGRQGFGESSSGPDGDHH